jgi:hypothetical protein
MSTYENIKLIHMSVGAVALIAFWVAALSRKGGPVHRAAGTFYLLSLICVMASTLPFVAVAVIEGRAAQVMLLSYLLMVTLTAAWLTWRSVRDRRDFTRYTGILFRGLGTVIALLGVVILYLSTTAGSAARSVFLAGASLVGIISGSNMLMLARSGSADKRWWLAQHLNGAALNFAATHASFFGIGLVKLMPEFRGPWLPTLSQLTILALALVLRLWIGRRYFRMARLKQISSEPLSVIRDRIY